MSADSFVLLVFACLAVNLSPGPSVLLVSSVSAARGSRAGLFAVLGMTAGAMVHVLLAASGLAALLATSPAAFTTVQYLGAAYLIYCGRKKIPQLPLNTAVASMPGRIFAAASWWIRSIPR